MFPLLIFTYSVLKMLGWKKMSFLPSSTCMHSNIWYYHALTTYIKHVNMTTSYRKTISDTKEEISESRSRINGENTNKGREALLSDSVSLCKRTFQSFNFVLLLHLQPQQEPVLFLFPEEPSKRRMLAKISRTTFTNYFRTQCYLCRK